MYILLALLAFGLLIIGHELGHFTLAKLNGVKVEEFSIGMGPKILSIKGKETEYLIKALPIGGYVRMLGEEEDVKDERAFSSQSPFRKISIIAAGPIMNLILAVVLFGIISINTGYFIPKVSEIVPNSPAQSVGIKPGDEIVKVNNKKVSTWDDFAIAINTSNGKTLTLQINREGITKDIEVTPMKNIEENRFMVGIAPTKIDNPSFGQGIKYGFDQSKSLIREVFSVLKTIFTGKASKNDIGGPLTIIKVSGAAAKAGIWNLLSLTAILSVQLAIFNLLPFPALDGGWLVILLIELITRKKINDKIVATLNYIGFSLLMVLMILVTIKDILFPIKF